MTDKYEEALADMGQITHTHHGANGFEAFSVRLRPKAIETIRHALANCLPELKEGWRYYGVRQLRSGKWCVSVCKPGRSGVIRAHGDTPRAAAQEAIKKIQGGGE